MNKVFPKILIIGETFHLKSGGGITLSNLFKDWPKEKLANATDYKRLDMAADFKDISLFELYNDKRIFNFMKYNSIGRYSRTKISEISTTKKRVNFRNIIKSIFFNFVNYTNISHLIFRYRISDKFISWINDFNPDFIYSQLGSLELILFIKEIHYRTNIPIAIHIMDDWPLMYGEKGLFKKYWKNIFDIKFKELLDITSIFLSISENMSEEYEHRYRKKFIPFHNPLDLKFWLQNIKNRNFLSKELSILHAGRIGRGIQSSLIDAAQAIDLLNKEGYNIKLNIQSSYIDTNFINKISRFNCVIINPIAEYSQIPEILRSADVLLLCNDFDKNSINFLRFSMPTKASEYMISGVPIVMYCSHEMAVYKYAKKYDLAYLVSENNIHELKNGFKEILTNKELAKELSTNAYNHAKLHFDSENVRENFRLVFYNYEH